jgi:hypothetical protein
MRFLPASLNQLLSQSEFCRFSYSMCRPRTSFDTEATRAHPSRRAAQNNMWDIRFLKAEKKTTRQPEKRIAEG